VRSLRHLDMLIWWGNDTTFDMDLPVGGRWAIVRRQDGTEYTATGEYLAVDANELRELPPGGTSASEAGWQQGFDLMAAAWSKPGEP
jgi:Activator of Hsp90 ATPase homolog 1-like protein